MAVTQNTYTGDGTTVLFSFTFPYLDQADVKVSLNGVDTTAYTLANATTVQMNTAPSVGVGVRVYRATDIDDASATFFPGSAIRSEDLNRNFDQILYVSQETRTFAESTDSSAIQAQVTSAVNTANAANTTANNASTTANGIAGTANTALSNSTAAVTSANSAVTTANAALPKAGGTMTGSIAFAALQTTATTSAPSIVQLSNSISSTSEVLAATPKAVKDAKDDAVSTAASGAASIYLPRAGGTMTGVITYAAAQPRLVMETAKIWNWNGLTNNTSLEFTGIPSWAKRITVSLAGISTNGTSAEVIQIGDSGGFATSVYTGTCSFITSTGTASAGDSSSGFILMGQTASTPPNVLSGRVTLDLMGTVGGLNYWACNGVLSRIDVIGGATNYFQKFVAGYKGLSNALDRIRLTTLVGSAFFDGGIVNIIYEG